MLDKFFHMAVLTKLIYNLNSINLYNGMKEILRDNINWDRNYFAITDKDHYHEMYLIVDIRKLYNRLCSVHFIRKTDILEK